MSDSKHPEFAPRLVDERVISQVYSLSLSWLRADRADKRLLPFVRLTGKGPRGMIRYDLQRVAEALAQLEEGGSQPKPRPHTPRKSLTEPSERPQASSGSRK